MAQPYFSMQLCQIATIVPLWARMGMHVQVRVGLSVGMAAQVCRDQYHEQSRSRSETETKRHLEHLLAQWAMQARSSTVGIVSPTTGRVWVRSGLVWGKRSVLGARGSVTIANHSREWLTFAHAPRALIASCTVAFLSSRRRCTVAIRLTLPRVCLPRIRGCATRPCRLVHGTFDGILDVCVHITTIQWRHESDRCRIKPRRVLGSVVQRPEAAARDAHPAARWRSLQVSLRVEAVMEARAAEHARMRRREGHLSLVLADGDRARTGIAMQKRLDAGSRLGRRCSRC